MPWKFFSVISLATVLNCTVVEASDPTAEAIQIALNKAIPLIKKSTEEYPKHRQCFSCHHQAIPALTLKLAKQRGFAVDTQALEAIAELTEADLESALDDYKSGKGQPGGVERAGYALFTLEIAGASRTEVTAAVTDYLMVADKDRDHWRSRSNRPPTEASDFTTSFLAIRGLRGFGPEAQKIQRAKRVEVVGEWIKTAIPQDTEDRVFRLFALKEIESGDVEISKATSELIKLQHDDGGWSQLDGNESDAYATGSTLVSLHQAGGISIDNPVYRRGLAFLIKAQLDDGSWHIVSRSKPFQPYFESGFPHGKDQFISMAASGWASSALLLAVPKS